jgi:hypothetical protein
MIDEKYKVAVEYCKKFLPDREEGFDDGQTKELRHLFILSCRGFAIVMLLN